MSKSKNNKKNNNSNEILTLEQIGFLDSEPKSTGNVARKDFEALRSIVKILHTKLKEITNERDQLKAQLQKEKAKPNINLEKWSTILQKPKPKEQLLVVNAMTSELEEIKKREKNIIIVGIPEKKDARDEEEKKQHDEGIVEKLLENIGCKEEKAYVKRLRSKDPKKEAPILLELKNGVNRNLVLKSAQKLRDNKETKNIYFNPDLTQAQKLQDYNLRKERNDKNKDLPENSPFRYGIRGNQVVKIKKN